MSASLSTAPGHVRKDLVFDVDTYDIEGGDKDQFLAWSRIQNSTPDLYYSRYYDGFWVLNRASDISAVLQDSRRFCSTQGTSIPAIKNVPPFPPLYIDPPTHQYFRKPLSLALGGKNPKLLAENALEIVTRLIDDVLDKRRCEFMHDFALHIPVAIVLSILDLPFEDRGRLIPYADIITHSSDQEKRDQAINGVFAYADDWVSRRRASPGTDLISQLLEVKVEDRSITHQETTAMVALLLLGGLDSVSHTMGAMMRSLAERPDLQERFAAEPDLVSTGLNELFRRHSVNAMARTVTEDLELNGVEMKAGDRVLVAAWLYGLDREKFSSPLDIDLERKPDMLAFGTGVHTCVGMSLARLEVRTLLQEWFRRIPSFRITPGDAPITMTGQTLGTVHLPLSW